MNNAKYSSYIENCTKKIESGSNLAVNFNLQYGVVPNDFFEAFIDLDDYPPVKGLAVSPLTDINSNITGLLFIDIANNKEFIIGGGLLILNRNKLTNQKVLIVEDKYAAFKFSVTKYPVFFLKKADKEYVGKIQSKWPNINVVVPCHQQSDLRRRLNTLNVRIIGLSEPVNPFSDPKELQDEIDYCIANTLLKEWGAPKDIKTILHAVKPLTRAMLPRDLSDYVHDEADRADNMSPDFVAVCTLVTLCSVIGAKVSIKPKNKDDWSVVPNLWGGIVAPPSSKKTPAFNAGTRPLDQLILNARQSYDRKEREYEINQMVHETNEKNLKEKLKDAIKKGDEVKQHALTQQLLNFTEFNICKPILKRYKTNDASPEALAELEKTNPNGILVCRDELVGLLSSLDGNDGDTGRSFYLEGWNGNHSYEFDRIMRGSGFIENHCLSILGGIQPDKLINYLEPSIKGNANDGLLQRFQLLVYPDVNKWEYRDEYPNREVRNSIYSLFKALDELTPDGLVQMGAYPIDESNPRPYFKFTNDAQAAFIKWTSYLHNEVIPNEEHSIIGQHLDKYAKLMPALALTFHLIDCIQIGLVGLVSLRCVEMAIEWCDYLESHARRIYGLVLQSSTIRAATLSQKLLKLEKDNDWILNGFSAREIQRKNWKGLTSPEAISDALDVLVLNEWLALEEIESTVRGGRPTKKYWINPKIYENRPDKTDRT